MVKDATEYEWSSARAHVEGRDALGLLDIDLWKELKQNRYWQNRDWREVLLRTRDEEANEIAALRQATRSGRPLGPEGFVERLEATFGRKLNAKRTGRPKKPPLAAAAKM